MNICNLHKSTYKQRFTKELALPTLTDNLKKKSDPTKIA